MGGADGRHGGAYGQPSGGEGCVLRDDLWGRRRDGCEQGVLVQREVMQHAVALLRWWRRRRRLGGEHRESGGRHKR
jgi:hypothetical protein